MSKTPDPDRLKDLDERIRAAREARAPRPSGQDRLSQGQLAWQMVTELVTGLLIGFGIGYGLDSLFGTRPVLMVVMTLFGLAAGIKTMLRTAKLAEGKTDDNARGPGEDR